MEKRKKGKLFTKIRSNSIFWHFYLFLLIYFEKKEKKRKKKKKKEKNDENEKWNLQLCCLLFLVYLPLFDVN